MLVVFVVCFFAWQTRQHVNKPTSPLIYKMDGEIVTLVGSKLGGSWLIFGVLGRLWWPNNRSKMALAGVLKGSWRLLEGSWRGLGAILGPSWAILAPRANKTTTSWSFGPPGPPKLEAKTEQKSIQNGSKIHSIFSLLLGSIFHRFLSRFCIDFGVDFWSVVGCLVLGCCV